MEQTYIIQVKLDQSKPTIQRKLSVSSYLTLADLHRVLQIVMPWQGLHLYMFQGGYQTYGNPEDTGDDDASLIQLRTVLPDIGDKIKYEYDFTDSWVHTIELVSIAPPAPDLPSVICLGGQYEAPPEDAGGILIYNGSRKRRRKVIDLDAINSRLSLEFPPVNQSETVVPPGRTSSEPSTQSDASPRRLP